MGVYNNAIIRYNYFSRFAISKEIIWKITVQKNVVPLVTLTSVVKRMKSRPY